MGVIMNEWIKTIFKDKPNATTPITSLWLNKLQDYLMQLGLIKDYIVDSGVSNGADFVKYASGRIIIRQTLALNKSLNSIPSPIPIMPHSANKLRFARANIATYDVSLTKYVTTAYVEGFAGNIIIQAVGIAGNTTEVTFEVNAWWK